MDNVTRNYERVNRFFNSIHVENMKKVRPSFDKYLEKASGLHEEFAELLKEHGAKIFGCEESCIEDCLDTSFVTFWEIPMCVKDCKCSLNELVNVEGKGKKASKRINLHHVIEEAEGDKESWELFKRNKD